MSLHLAGVTRAIKVLPVLAAAAMAFTALTPAAPAAAFGISNIGTISTNPLVIGPTIYYPPDLVVSASSQIASDDSFSTAYRVTILVRNIGDGRSTATQVSIWDRGQLPRLSVPGLSAHGSVYLTYNTSRPYPSGDCTLVFNVDPGNLVAEWDEYNNNASTLLNTFSPSQC
jgi:subtilase family serine protease